MVQELLQLRNQNLYEKNIPIIQNELPKKGRFIRVRFSDKKNPEITITTEMQAIKLMILETCIQIIQGIYCYCWRMNNRLNV